jgi:hypothetical protein
MRPKRRQGILVALLCLFALVSLSAASTVKLYLKDGDYHLVTEYHVEGDRVRFYSTERSEWEEVPLEIVDLKRTESEQQRLEEHRREDAKFQEEENKAEKQAAQEAASVPKDPGAYLVSGDKLIAVPQGESRVVNDRKRSILKAISPVPLINGKATVELAGLHAPTVTQSAAPEFYFRLAQAERFGIIHLTPHKNARVAEKLTIIPVANLPIEQPDLIEVFRKQVGEDLYKVWPVKPLVPGEYAVVEYSEGELNMQIWDFSFAAAPSK